MNNHISEEIIEIGEEKYTLFINRNAAVTWERLTEARENFKNISETASQLEEKTNETGEIKIENGTNPFEMFEESKIFKEYDILEDMYLKFFWIALYTHHKLNIDDVKPIYKQAITEYGLDQIIQLANKMFEKANKDMTGTKKLKNL